MKSKTIILIQFIIAMFITSCDFDDNLIEYEEQLVVFASINAGLPVSDTVYVSRTAGLSESVDAQDLYIDDANVRLVNLSNGSQLDFYSLGDGRYYPIDLSVPNLDSILIHWSNYIIESGKTYRLIVTHEDDSIAAQTTVPEQMIISSEESYDYSCPDGTLEPVRMIDVNNLQNMTIQDLLWLYQNPVEYIEQNNINVDSVDFKIGDCYSKSFASAPLFSVDF
ncbi:MAG: DUF4249 family protein, partial [Candidatus Neomarinimicrobiota bacterium]